MASILKARALIVIVHALAPVMTEEEMCDAAKVFDKVLDRLESVEKKIEE